MRRALDHGRNVLQLRGEYGDKAFSLLSTDLHFLLVSIRNLQHKDGKVSAQAPDIRDSSLIFSS